jgi:hypothetical protein
MAAFMLLLGQTFACFLERAEIIPCVHECDHAHDSQSAGDDTSTGCDVAGCHGSFVTITHEFCAPAVSIPSDLHVLDESTPDGPVREIDHPPQLS